MSLLLKTKKGIVSLTLTKQFDANSLISRDLKNCLQSENKVNHAILQVFVEPRDEYNNCILVDWSKDHLNIDRRFSKVKLLDFKYSIYQRASTFEQIENFNKVKVTSKTVIYGINEEINNIREYVKLNSPKNYDITNLTMMMKIDKSGKLNLLWTP